MENKIFDSEFVENVQHGGVELHKIFKVLKITIKKCAELEQEIRHLENGNENPV